jgi:hypothetical protein
MHELLSSYGSREDFAPMACDALVATGLLPAGVWL